jgi:hypothetical protein
VSLVGFRFLDTRVLGLPIPFHRHFSEVNLRFYVRRRAEEGWRRAVVFIREVVPRPLIAAVARLAYNEPYRARPMRHSVTMDETGGEVSYEWREAGQWHRITASTTGLPAPLAEGGEAQFVAEHYWGYTTQRDGGTIEYRVTHPAWRIWQTRSASFEGDASANYGPALGEALSGAPVSAFVAEGSAVQVFSGQRLSLPQPK